MTMTDVFSLTRAARLRARHAPQMSRPAAPAPVVLPRPPLAPSARERPAPPSALASLMMRHDRLNERHLHP